MNLLPLLLPIFFFNDTAPTEIYTLSLHDALPISRGQRSLQGILVVVALCGDDHEGPWAGLQRIQRRGHARSEEHTSELQSRSDLVCRLLLEKKKPKIRGQRTCAKTRSPQSDLVRA